jgi:hypothetical protein
LAGLPVAAQAVVSRTLGHDSVGYRITRTGAGLRALNLANGFSAQLGSGGLVVRSGRARLGLALTGYGYGPWLRPVLGAAPQATLNRVVYRRGPVSEWYANGPLGLEQGFTLAAPPRGRTPAR